MNFKIEHTSIRVFDIEKSVDFYKKALFMEVERELDKKDNFTLVFLTDKRKNYQLELTYNYGQKDKYQIGNGYSHIAFNIQDFDTAHTLHKSLNIQATDIYSVGNGRRLYFITDPDGYKIEILEDK